MEIESQEKVIKRPKKNPLFFFVVGLLLLSIIFSVYFFFVKEKSFDLEKKSAAPTGEIYLTLSPLGTEKPNIYKLDVETMELEEYFKDSPYKNYMAKFSPDGENMVFVRMYEDYTSQILSMEVSSGELVEITSRSESFPRNPVFSSDGGSIVYWVFDEEGYDFGEKPEDHFGEKPEDHSIYVVDVDGKKQQIASGVHPVFVSDKNEVIFMETNGFSTFNLETEEEENFLSWEEEDYFGYIEKYLEKEGIEEDLPIWTIFRFNISPEGNYLVVTNTLTSTIFYFEILSWKPFEHNFYTYSFSGPNWPVFSPDGEFLAFQGFVSEGDYFSWIEILHAKNIDSLSSESLGLFGLDVIDEWDPQSIWVTDWIVK